MPDSVATEPNLPAHIARADQIIIEGEQRICRLNLLIEAMAEWEYDTKAIRAVLARHSILLESWRLRRASMIERYAGADLKNETTVIRNVDIKQAADSCEHSHDNIRHFQHAPGADNADPV